MGEREEWPSLMGTACVDGCMGWDGWVDERTAAGTACTVRVRLGSLPKVEGSLQSPQGSERWMVRGGWTASFTGANSFNNSKTLWGGNGTVAAAVFWVVAPVFCPAGPVLRDCFLGDGGRGRGPLSAFGSLPGNH